MNQDRRGFRFSFSAAAEIAPESAPNATVAVRATELSLRGCYVESSSPFAVGAAVLVKIFHADQYFEAKGTVLYIKPASGMGLVFRDIKPYCQGVLQKWILSTLQNRALREDGPG
jgi:hypothetical protein